MIFRIKELLTKIKNKISNNIFYYLGNKNIESNWDVKKDSEFIKYRAFINNNKCLNYKVKFVNLQEINSKHKWVGAQGDGENIFFIPNDDETICIYNSKTEKLNIKAEVRKGLFKWTGGCKWNNKIYYFPRSSNEMLYYDYKKETLGSIKLDKNYKIEHHYGGVCTKEGIVYQPPRNTDHILVWDLNKGVSSKIQLFPQCMKVKLRYCGSILHPNGFIYFFPESKGKVLKLNISTQEWCLIGIEIYSSVFDSKIDCFGNIYGYSAYGSGIVKVNIEKDYVEVLYKNIDFGSFGTKLGADGAIYSVPGDSQNIWRYNIYDDVLEKIYILEEVEKAKYAGGVSQYNGNIILVPAEAKKICILELNSDRVDIEKSIYDIFWSDNY